MSNVPFKAVVNKADENFLNALRVVMASQDSTEGNEVRTKWEDGTPAHARFINNVLFQYDNGEVPLISLRQQAWKSAIKEMLWIYQDQSNDLDLLKEKYGKRVSTETIKNWLRSVLITEDKLTQVNTEYIITEFEKIIKEHELP